jgi:hypothetical protein
MPIRDRASSGRRVAEDRRMTVGSSMPIVRPEELLEPRWARLLFASTTGGWLWLVVRL